MYKISGLFHSRYFHQSLMQYLRDLTFLKNIFGENETPFTVLVWRLVKVERESEKQKKVKQKLYGEGTEYF